MSPGHVENIETLVSGRWYGMRCTFTPPTDLRCSGTEAHQAPLYYLLFAAWQRVAGVKAMLLTKERTTMTTATGSSPPTVRPIFASSVVEMNVLLGALTVLFTFYAVRLVSTDPWTPVVGASIVAFLPRSYSLLLRDE